VPGSSDAVCEMVRVDASATVAPNCVEVTYDVEKTPFVLPEATWLVDNRDSLLAVLLEIAEPLSDDMLEEEASVLDPVLDSVESVEELASVELLREPEEPSPLAEDEADWLAPPVDESESLVLVDWLPLAESLALALLLEVAELSLELAESVALAALLALVESLALAESVALAESLVLALEEAELPLEIAESLALAELLALAESLVPALEEAELPLEFAESLALAESVALAELLALSEADPELLADELPEEAPEKASPLAEELGDSLMLSLALVLEDAEPSVPDTAELLAEPVDEVRDDETSSETDDDAEELASVLDAKLELCEGDAVDDESSVVEELLATLDVAEELFESELAADDESELDTEELDSEAAGNSPLDGTELLPEVLSDPEAEEDASTELVADEDASARLDTDELSALLTSDEDAAELPPELEALLEASAEDETAVEDEIEDDGVTKPGSMEPLEKPLDKAELSLVLSEADGVAPLLLDGELVDRSPLLDALLLPLKLKLDASLEEEAELERSPLLVTEDELDVADTNSLEDSAEEVEAVVLEPISTDALEAVELEATSVDEAEVAGLEFVSTDELAETDELESVAELMLELELDTALGEITEMSPIGVGRTTVGPASPVPPPLVAKTTDDDEALFEVLPEGEVVTPLPLLPLLLPSDATESVEIPEVDWELDPSPVPEDIEADDAD